MLSLHRVCQYPHVDPMKHYPTGIVSARLLLYVLTVSVSNVTLLPSNNSMEFNVSVWMDSLVLLMKDASRLSSPFVLHPNHSTLIQKGVNVGRDTRK